MFLHPSALDLSSFFLAWFLASLLLLFLVSFWDSGSRNDKEDIPLNRFQGGAEEEPNRGKGKNKIGGGGKGGGRGGGARQQQQQPNQPHC